MLSDTTDKVLMQKGVFYMNWICKHCGKTMTTNAPTAKPTGGTCYKDKNGKIKPHNWVKRQGYINIYHYYEGDL